MKNVSRLAIAVTASLLLATPALAHPGHDGGFGLIQGFGHPLNGVDHVLAMIAVGLYAAQLGGRALWTLPAAFVAAMIAGGIMGNAAMSLPLTEPGIAFSVIAMGLLIGLGLKLPTTYATALVAVFAVFHGHAHGREIGEASSFIPFAAGFVAATSLLHLTGIIVGQSLKRLQHRQVLSRSAGAASAATGLAFLAGKAGYQLELGRGSGAEEALRWLRQCRILEGHAAHGGRQCILWPRR